LNKVESQKLSLKQNVDEMINRREQLEHEVSQFNLIKEKENKSIDDLENELNLKCDERRDITNQITNLRERLDSIQETLDEMKIEYEEGQKDSLLLHDNFKQIEDELCQWNQSEGKDGRKDLLILQNQDSKKKKYQDKKLEVEEKHSSFNSDHSKILKELSNLSLKSEDYRYELLDDTKDEEEEGDISKEEIETLEHELEEKLIKVEKETITLEELFSGLDSSSSISIYSDPSSNFYYYSSEEEEEDDENYCVEPKKRKRSSKNIINESCGSKNFLSHLKFIRSHLPPKKNSIFPSLCVFIKTKFFILSFFLYMLDSDNFI